MDKSLFLYLVYFANSALNSNIGAKYRLGLGLGSLYVYRVYFANIARIFNIQKIPPNATCSALAAVVLTIIFVNNNEYHQIKKENKI